MVGRSLGGYQLTTLLGSGGMGEVYQARDAKLGRDVAIKILPGAFTSNPDRLARFEREARMLAALNHPNICAIYGFEESAPETEQLPSGSSFSNSWTARRCADACRASPPARPRRWLAARAGAVDCAPDRRGARRRPRQGDRASRPEAGEHQDHVRTASVKVLDFGLAKAAGGDGVARPRRARRTRRWSGEGRRSSARPRT